MTDRELRDDLIRELRRRVTDCTNAANEEEYFAGLIPADEPERAAGYRRAVARCRRRAQHFEQAIALIKAAPMPTGEEAEW